jgi:hypothetical protein
MRPKHKSVGEALPMSGLTTDRAIEQPVATFPKGHEARVDDAGNLHIYRAKAPTADTTPDTVYSKPSKLREALERINQRNRQEDAQRTERIKEVYK